ncbi:hypothetical protein [Rossellomorea sp. DA94]|uniref:tetratricopeptide repeat protein n=1 Tax=Rossellomorea sp. DA94 TaxID=3038653 RepID=UPI00244D0868|nr:hypothetical protein [Rossellomorea sp. DA94]WGG44670.1 hypothetical protein P8596_18125 [Rossellomorea sp. DA94]
MDLASKLASLLFSYSLPHIKNQKVVRDLQVKWLKDNYSQKTKLMFEAAIADAKTSVGIPDDLIHELLEDKQNRAEVFRWIIEGMSYDQFKEDRLNLIPYMERYPNQQDFIVPFFMLILSQLIDYKEKYWDPEFLQILSNVQLINDAIHKGFERVEKSQEKVFDKVEETNFLLKSSLETVGYKDLNELINEGKTIKARELAKDRLRKKHLKKEDMRELNAIIATSFMTSGFENEAIPYLYTVVALCEDDARKKRTEALIKLLQRDLTGALSLIQEAISNEGKSKKNDEILINIYIQQEELQMAAKLINESQEDEYDFLKGQVFLFLKEYDEVIKLTDMKLTDENELRDWLMLKVEALVLKQEEQITEKSDYTNINNTFEEVIPILDQIEYENENERQLIRINELRASIYFRKKNFTEAATYYRKVYDKKKHEEKDYFKNLITSYYLDENWSEAILLLKERLSSGFWDIEDIIFFARIYIDSGLPEKAVSLLKYNQLYLKKKDSEYISFIFTLIESLFMSLKHTEIHDLLDGLESENEIDIYKGHYAMLQHDWDSAVKFLEKGVINLNGEAQIEVKLELIRAYENRGEKEDYQKIVTLVPTIPHWMMHESLFNRYIHALFQIGRYEELLSFYKGEQVPYKSTLLFDLATTIYFNLQWYEIAKVNYKSLYQETKNIKYLFRYSNCLFHLGETKKCLQTLSNAEQMVEKNGNIEDYNLISIAYLEATQYRKSLEYAYKTYIAGQNIPRVLRFYFWNFLQLTQFVENPEQEWVDAYQKIFEEFHTQFPEEEPLYEQHKALEENGELSEEISNVLKKTASQAEHSQNLYKVYKIPGMLYADILDKGLFETWGHIADDPTLDIWVYTGELIEIQKGIRTIRSSDNILCDIFTLLSFNQIGLLDKLSKSFNLYIYQDQFEKIFEEYTRTKLVQENGVKTISYQNEKIVMHEFSSEYVKQTLQYQEKFIQWLNENCIKVGQVITNDSLNDKKQSSSVPLIDNIMMLAKKNSFSLAIDSTIIRDLGKEHYSVQSFNLVDFLYHLQLKKEISTDDFYEKLGTLMRIGYVLLPIRSDVFIHHIEKNKNKLNEELTLLFQYLKRREFSEDYILNIVTDLLKWIWLESISHLDRYQLTDYLCIVVTFQKNKRDTVEKILEICLGKFGPLVQHQYEKMELCIYQWLKSQAII